jgi:hypothetical protein
VVAITTLEARLAPASIPATPIAATALATAPIAAIAAIAATATLPATPLATAVALGAHGRLAIARYGHHDRPARKAVDLSRRQLGHEQLIRSEPEECPRLFQSGLAILTHELVRLLLRVVHR